LRNNFIHRLYNKMFKEITSGLSKFFTKQLVFTVMLLLFLAVVLLYYTGSKSLVVDNMDTGYTPMSAGSSKPVMGASPQVAAAVSAPTVTAPTGTNPNSKYALQPVANPSDLLPSDSNSDWGTFNNINQTNIATPDLLQAGYHIGLDTIGQTLRNANLQLRSDPIIPKKDVGPWQMSTIEPDYGRVPLEVGCGPK